MQLKKAFLVPIVALPLLIGSSGCADMPKSTSVAVGGAVAGAAVGARAGGVYGALAGAVIGGVIGNQIGSYLDEEDKKKLIALEQKALESGKPVSFVSTKSSAKITSTPAAPTTESVRSYSLSSNVDSNQLVVVEPRSVDAYVDTPVYSSTNEKTTPKMIVKKGSAVSVPALVESDKKWGAVIENDVVLGYVPVKYLDPKIAKKAAPKLKVAKAVPPAAVATTSSSVGTGSAKPSDAGAAKAAEPPMQVVRAVGTCKVVTRTVDTGSSATSFTENVTYCKEPPKGWKTLAA